MGCRQSCARSDVEDPRYDFDDLKPRTPPRSPPADDGPPSGGSTASVTSDDDAARSFLGAAAPRAERSATQPRRLAPKLPSAWLAAARCKEDPALTKDVSSGV